jgi:hypothetical protein
MVMMFISCNPTNYKKENIKREKVIFLNKIINKECSINNQVYDTTLFHFHDLLITTKKQSSFIYLLNSDCSFCVGQFIDFLFHLKETNYPVPVNVILNEGHTEIVKFYISKYNQLEKLQINFHENKNNYFTKNKLKVENGNFFYINNEGVNRFHFND